MPRNRTAPTPKCNLSRRGIGVEEQPRGAVPPFGGQEKLAQALEETQRGKRQGEEKYRAVPGVPAVLLPSLRPAPCALRFRLTA